VKDNAGVAPPYTTEAEEGTIVRGALEIVKKPEIYVI
jgi:hypothetical protein